jgi:hypothetical protein
MTVREEAHRLIDAVPDDRLSYAMAFLRQWAQSGPSARPRRRFRTTGIFDGEPDLAAHSEEIVQEAWNRGEPRSA